MGQNASTVQEYTPDNKPAKKENFHALEKPKNKNEDNELNERESEKETQKKLGINVIYKDSEMPLKTESFIIDCIIFEKLKHSGHFAEIAHAIAKKLNDQYGGFWCAIIEKPWCAPLNGCIVTINGSHIVLAYENCHFTIFQSFKKLGINVLDKKCINKDCILPMKMELESFVIDAVLVEKLKHSGSLMEIGRAVKEKLEDQYRGCWTVIIAKNWHSSESGYCLATIPGSYIVLKYDFCTYTIFKCI